MRSLMEGRQVTITITLDAKDNEILEVAAGATRMTPDDLLKEILSQLPTHLKKTIADFKNIVDRTDPATRVALRGRALAREVLRRVGFKR